MRLVTGASLARLIRWLAVVAVTVSLWPQCVNAQTSSGRGARDPLIRQEIVGPDGRGYNDGPFIPPGGLVGGGS